MEQKPLRTLAEMAAIIACIIAVLTYFNIYPSCSRQDEGNNTEVIVDGTKNESNVEITPEQTTSYENDITEKDNIPNEEITPEEKYQSEHRTWAEMTGKDLVVLPFIKHRKMNYFKHDLDANGWGAIVGYLVLFGLPLISFVCAVCVCMGADDTGDETDISTFGKVLIGIFAIVILTFIILEFLAWIGYY